MSLLCGTARTVRAVAGRVRAFAGDGRGVAAVEFAFIAPVLLSLYFVTMEVAQGIETNRKVGRMASMISDLVTQQQTTNKADIDAIMKIGEAILTPYNRSVPVITVTAIRISDEENPKAKVDWSRKLVNGASKQGEAPNSITTVPAKLKIRGSYLVRVETDLSYKPVIAWAAEDKPTLGLAAAFDNIDMKETYYDSPRIGQEVPCSNC